MGEPTVKQQYDDMYNMFRIQGVGFREEWHERDDIELLLLAYRSYLYSLRNFTGWRNHRRGQVWFDLMCDRYPEHIFPF